MKNAKIGQWVVVDGYAVNGPIKVVRVIRDMSGGVQLDRRVADFMFWNVDELSPAPSPKSPRKAPRNSLPEAPITIQSLRAGGST